MTLVADGWPFPNQLQPPPLLLKQEHSWVGPAQPSPAHRPSKSGGLPRFFPLERSSPLAESRQPGRRGEGPAKEEPPPPSGLSLRAVAPPLSRGWALEAGWSQTSQWPSGPRGGSRPAKRGCTGGCGSGGPRCSGAAEPALRRPLLPRPLFLPATARHGAGSLAGAVGASAHLQDHRHRGLQRGQDLLDGALLRRHLPRQHRGHHRRGFQGEGGGDRRRAHQGPGVGHSRPREVPEEHGGALLPQRPRCGVCLRRHKNGILPQPEKLDRGVQRPCRPGSRPQSARGKQV